MPPARADANAQDEVLSFALTKLPNLLDSIVGEVDYSIRFDFLCRLGLGHSRVDVADLAGARGPVALLLLNSCSEGSNGQGVKSEWRWKTRMQGGRRKTKTWNNRPEIEFLARTRCRTHADGRFRVKGTTETHGQSASASPRATAQKALLLGRTVYGARCRRQVRLFNKRR